MKKIRFVMILFVLFLCATPSLALVSAQQATESVVVQIRGGRGVHFIIKNNSSDALTVHYSIEYKLWILGTNSISGNLVVQPGKKSTASFHPFGLFFPMTATLSFNENTVVRHGYIIGFNVIII